MVVGLFGTKRSAETWSRLTWVSYFSSMAVTFALLAGRPEWDRSELLPRTPVLSSVGCGLGLAGGVVAIWARLTLGRNWSGSITYKEDHRLVERGPYRWVRHPIYTGLLLMVLGTALVRGNRAAVLGLLLFLATHLWKLRREEALLRAHFPASFPAYRARTKALLPFVF